MAKGLRLNGVSVTVVAALPHYPNGTIPRRYRWRPLVIDRGVEFRVIRTFVPPLPSKGFGRRLLIMMSFMISALFALPLVRKVDAVFASNPQVLAAYPASAFAILHRCPMILNIDDLWPESLYDLGMLESPFGHRVGESIASVAYQLADGLTPISAGYLETLTSKYGIDSTKVHVIPGGVDLDLFATEEGVPTGTGFEVLYVGAFSRAYDFEQVLRAAELLSDEKSVRFVLQGSGELTEQLKSSIARMNLRNVSLRHKIVPRREAARLMLNASALIVPLAGTKNIERGLSSKIYEYQAAGKPIICCSQGVAGEYVYLTGSGVVVVPGDHSALAKCVNYLSNHRRAGEEMGARGRAVVRKDYAVDAVGMSLIRAVKNIRRGLSTSAVDV